MRLGARGPMQGKYLHCKACMPREVGECVLNVIIPGRGLVGVDVDVRHDR